MNCLLQEMIMFEHTKQNGMRKYVHVCFWDTLKKQTFEFWMSEVTDEHLKTFN